MDFEDQRRMFAMNMGGHPMANHHATNQQAVQQAAAQQAVQQVAQQVAQPPPPHTRILMPEASLPMVVGTRPGPMDTTMATITTQMAGTQQITMHHTVHQQQLAHHQQQQQAAQQQVAQQQIAQQQQHIEVAVGITDTSGEPGSSLVGVLEEGTEVKRVEQQDPLAIDVGGGGGEMAAAGHSNMEQSRWCLVCDKGLPTQDTSQEFVDLYKATMTVSQRKLSAMLGRLVGLTLYKAHSDVLCRRCYGLVDQVDGLEIELADTKMELVQQYEATIAHRQPHAKKEIERPTLEVDVEWEESNESEVVDNDEDDPDCTATGTKRKKKRKTKRKGGRPRKVKLTTKIKIDSVSEGGDADADGRPRKRGRGRPRKKDKEEDDYIPPGAPTKDCPACKKVVHAKKYLIHLSTHRLFPCPFCESVFKRKIVSAGNIVKESRNDQLCTTLNKKPEIYCSAITHLGLIL
ncbi:uncharacterized protein LOC121857319 isoform X3 [Homarus americanus]|uniref:uncharacterized protein LOC121857319 isoform X3 n=1 Tax=Homarus americanus TaxID=6706 RepID=UPI001C47DF28|nr:uncharacterized protein LOC121857319 isoform X3 [Homarus americanus]